MALSEQPRKPLLVVTGGGTGGHLYPALAVVEAVQESDPEQEILYIGRDAARDRDEVEKRNIPFAGLPLMGLRRRITIQNIKALWLFWRGVSKAKRMMKEYPSGVVFGVGGYVSAPAMIAGKRLRWQVCLHEQNTIPGLVNRTLAKWCDKVYATFEISQRYLKNPNCTVPGFPLRRSLLEMFKNTKSQTNENEVPHVLLIGGSQGAKRLVELAKPVFDELDKQGIAYTATVQTGERNFKDAASFDWSSNVKLVPYIHNMAEVYAQTDVIISRAGAGSLSEIALWGIPAILVPYPYASGNHQEHNAKAWVDAGAAVCLREQELSSNLLYTELSGLLSNNNRRKVMHGGAASLARSDAAQFIARDLIAMLKDQA